jgi:hypothetical protein
MSTIGRLNEEKQRLHQSACRSKAGDDTTWCEAQILDPLQIWDHAEV